MTSYPTTPYPSDYGPPPPPPPTTPCPAPDDDSTTNTYPSPPPPPTYPIPLPPPAPPSHPSQSSVGIIVGTVLGAVAFVLLFCIFFIYYMKNKNKRERHDNDHGPQDEAFKNNTYASSPNSNHIEPVMPELQPSPPAPWRPLLKPSSPRSVVTTKDKSASNSNNSSGGESNPVPAAAPPVRITFGFSRNEFKYEELAKATDGFSAANLLGEGGFGCVHRGLLPDGKEVAVKQLKAGGSQGEREFQAEVEIISRVHHRHLVTLVGYCITGTHRLLVYEFVPNNTLDYHLHGDEKERAAMDWPARVRIALGAAKGLSYLHEDCHPKIIHRDIKASNILLDSKFEAKVADFGLAKFLSDINTHVSTRVMGTLGYLAPEYALSGKLTDKSDVFSFGVVLLELITGCRPLDSSHALKGDSLVEWAMPLLPRALEDENFDVLVDPRLQNEYDPKEMVRMVACAAASIRYSAKTRPRMSQIVRALEGEASLADLNEGIRPGQSSVYTGGSLDYDTAQYKEQLTKFRKMVLGGSSEVSGPTSEYGVNPSDSSSGESQHRQTQRERQIEMRRTNNSHGSGTS